MSKLGNIALDVKIELNLHVDMKIHICCSLPAAGSVQCCSICGVVEEIDSIILDCDLCCTVSILH